MLSLRALPRSEQRETHFSTMIEVRVEADRAVPCRPEVDHGRLVGILGREVDVELVDATGVRRVLRPTKTVNSSFKNVHTAIELIWTNPVMQALRSVERSSSDLTNMAEEKSSGRESESEESSCAILKIIVELGVPALAKVA